MKKVWTLLLALLLLTFVGGVSAQGDASIVDLVTQLANAEEAEFTLLSAALQSADPALISYLDDGIGSRTVFAPTDAAFTALLEETGMDTDAFLADAAFLSDVLSYHVVPQQYDSAALLAMGDVMMGSMLPDGVLRVTVAGDQVAVNDVSVINPDVVASNGVVHVVDEVLLPPQEVATVDGVTNDPTTDGTLVEAIVNDVSGSATQFETLLLALESAENEVLNTLAGGGQYTVFAPTDTAFSTTLAELDIDADALLEDTPLLTEVLSYHVVPGSISAEALGIAADGRDDIQLATLLPGVSLIVSFDENTIMVNDVFVSQVDLRTTNGTIHVIDGVLLPPLP